MEDKVILDFCAECGTLLQEGLGLEPEPKCPNCGEDVSERMFRIQGTFDKSEAEKLRDAR